MKYHVELKMTTAVIVEVEADNEDEALEQVRQGNYNYSNFNEQVLENLEEADACLEVLGAVG